MDLQYPSRFAATAPDRSAVIMGSGDVLTYGELEERSCRVANLFRSVGCDTGSHVAVLVENRLESVPSTPRSGWPTPARSDAR